MKKNRFINLQKAQGMVEFALVLPILLLVILGIIGFGHLFFSYSSTVSASREAARFGSAVGVTGSGIPRYRDCDAIRAAAVRMGAFAGVSNTSASVKIQYDKGPGTTPASPNDQCPPGGQSTVDPELGDRILIRVEIPYRSIVPLVNIPSFPLTATTTRTIVRSLQIGAAPTAESLCTQTDVSMQIMGVASSPTDTTPHSVVGQLVPMRVQVTGHSGTNPTTTNGLYLFDSTYDTPLFTQTGNAPSYPFSYTYMNAGNYYITGKYIYSGDVTNCYTDSSLDRQLHVVDAAETLLVINAPAPDQEYPTTNGAPVSVPVDVTLSAVDPATRASWAVVTVAISSAQALDSCTATLDAVGHGSCSLTFAAPGMGLTRLAAIRADYIGDLNYQLSSAFVDILITETEPVDTILDITVPDVGATFTAAGGSNTIPVGVSVQLTAVPQPDWSTVPLRTVNISSGAAACIATLNSAGAGSCTLNIAAPAAGVTAPVTIQANYPSNRDYGGSTDSIDINLRNPAAAPNCPEFVNGTKSKSGTNLSFQIFNRATTNVKVTSINLSWPDDPIAKLDELRFDFTNTNNSCDGTNAPRCLFNAQNRNRRIFPPPYSLNSISDAQGAMQAGFTYTMLFSFDNDLSTVIGTTQEPYRITVTFDHSCAPLIVEYID